MAKRKIIDVRRGGVLIPIGNNTYLAKGRTHEQGGIDIGDDLEIENNEVAQLKGDYLKIFSAQPILNGYSPSQLVLGGANPDRVFDAQERFKKINKLNDDGSRKKAEWGMKENSTVDFVTDMIPVIGTLKEFTRLVRNPSWEQAGWTAASLASDITGGIIGKVLIKSAKAAKIARAAGKRARVINPNFAKGSGAIVTTTGDFGINSYQRELDNKNKKRYGDRMKYIKNMLRY